jgi:hypothetical protein
VHINEQDLLAVTLVKFLKQENWLGQLHGGLTNTQNGITIKDNEIVVGGTSHTNDGIANSDSYQSNILGSKTSIFEIF